MAVLAAGWDLLVGRTGQISLGHALFFGVGAYSSALLFKYYGWTWWLTIPISVLITVGIALLIGLPCLRIKGPYLAMVTMAFPLVLTSFIHYYSDITGGQFGIRQLPTFFPMLRMVQRYQAHYYLTLSIMVISAVILYKIANSKRGMVFVSVLDDELASKACGINVTKQKLIAFAISGLFGGLAGCVNAHLATGAEPSVLSLTYSITPLVVTIIGGIGTIYGPIVGTYIYFLLDRYVFVIVFPLQTWHFFGIDWMYSSALIFMVIVIVIIIKWPRGIARTIVEKLEDLEEAREIEEIEKKKAK
jgi:branched-chain amino acid transport system permease protein